LADLRGAALSEANLREATLWGADLSGANLTAADLQDAVFVKRTSSTEIRHSVGLKDTVFGLERMRAHETGKQSCFSSETRRPKDFDPIKNGLIE
jgi:hypothetical protein